MTHKFMKIKLTNASFLFRKRLLMTIMRTFIFLCCATVFSLAPYNLVSQNSKIKVKEDKTITVDEIFKLIMDQTDYKFFYEKGIFNDFPKVEVKKGIISTNKLLKKSLSNGNLDITVTDNNAIVIKEKVYSIINQSVNQKQQEEVSGSVTDQFGQPLPGANIIEKGTNNGTQSDFDGKFSLIVSEKNAVLVISYLGFVTQEILISDSTPITIILQEDNAKLDEIVVVGYGAQRKADLTAPISTISGGEIASQPSVNAVSGLQGKIAGVQINNAGAPGSAPQIRIRGVGSVSFNPATGTSSASPLFVVDGVWTNDISFLNSSDIENMSILKDASAAAIYGNRSANGVVIITTKKAKQGVSTITYNVSTGLQKITNELEMANAFEYATLANEIYASQNNGDLLYDSNSLYKPGISDPEGTDWFHQLFRQAIMTNHNISFTGSNDKLSSAYSASYLDQDGLSKNQNFERITIKLHNEYKAFPNFKIGYNLFATLSELNDVPNNIFTSAYNAAPIVPVRYSDGGYGDPADYAIRSSNPQAAVDFFQPKTENNILLGNFYLDFEFAKNLSFYSNYNFEYSKNDFTNYVPQYRAGTFAFNSLSSLNVRSTEVQNWQIENIFKYENIFKEKHDFKLLLGQSTRSDRVYFIQGAARNVPNDYEGQYYLSLGDNSTENPTTVSDGGDYATGLSYFTRLNYSYDNKYLLTATFRADGSSKYTGDDRWGYFPSVGAGWVISQEGFMENQKVFNYLKIRGSWGINGNINVPSNITTLVASPVNSAIFGDSVFPSRSITALVPEQLSWERAITTDIGIEATSFNNRLTTEIDWYDRNNEDVIFTTPVLGSSGLGGSGFTANQATINNRGIEISVGWSDRIGEKFSYSISGNISYNTNEVTKVNSGGQLFGGFQGYDGSQTTPASKPITLTQVGLPVASFYGWNSIGVFQTQAEVDAYGQSGAAPGDLKFEDIDQNNIIDDRDRMVLGNPNPKYLYGLNLSFNYDKFDFSLDLQGVAGVDIYNANLGSIFSIGNFTKDFVDNRWNGEGTSNTYPTADLQRGSNTFPNSFYISKGDYLRVRNIQFGYTFSNLDKVGISKLRLYSALQNAFNFFSYKGFSPELTSFQGNPLNSGIDAGVYPLSAIYNFGVSVTF